jgi:AraC-like DNA-binding protein
VPVVSQASDQSVDRLSPFFTHSLPTASVFYSGQMCELASFEPPPSADRGHLHLLRSGRLVLTDHHGVSTEVTQPSVLFLPKGQHHQIRPEPEGVELICALVDFGHEARASLLSAMPAFLVLPLSKLPHLSLTLELLFQEAAHQRCGQQAALDLLVEYLLVQLLRHVMDESASPQGILAALADARLAKAVTAVHEQPHKNWTLERLAEVAHMSRAPFSNLFRERTGMTAMDYVTSWRMTLAQTLLKQGLSLKAIAPKVGYANEASLSRIFKQRLGLMPGQWQRLQK